MAKRIEIYTWWKCNHKCIFCIEKPNIDKWWDIPIKDRDIIKTLIKAKQDWFDHVTFLGGEPFLHNSFYSGIKIAKKLWFKVLVTTNWSILQYIWKSLLQLKYIDELIVSIHSLKQSPQTKISQSKSYIDFSKVFKNIQDYWSWDYLKVNVVLNICNKDEIWDIIDFSINNWVNAVSITYPDLLPREYWAKNIREDIVLDYNEAAEIILKEITAQRSEKIDIKLSDFPICLFREKKYLINMCDDLFYENRIKLTIDRVFLDRNKISPRNRVHIEKCNKCKLIWTCLWVSWNYEEIFQNPAQVYPFL